MGSWGQAAALPAGRGGRRGRGGVGEGSRSPCAALSVVEMVSDFIPCGAGARGYPKRLAGTRLTQIKGSHFFGLWMWLWWRPGG